MAAASAFALKELRRTSYLANPPYVLVYLLVRVPICRCEILLPWFATQPSDRAAASVAPDETVRADASAWHAHDGTHVPWGDPDGAAIDPASAVGTAMEAGAASARGVGRTTKACDRAGNQNYCEKCLHIPSVFVRPRRGAGP